MSSTERRFVPARELVELRRRLSLTQLELAERVGLSRRTVIRGEQRGIELPVSIWQPLRSAALLATSPSDTPVSPTRKRLRRSAELLRARSRVVNPKRRKQT